MGMVHHSGKMAFLQFDHAMSLKAKGDLDGALDLFKKLAEEFPDFAAIYGIMGDLFWDVGNLDEAMKCFQKVVELKPRSELGSLGLFHVLWELGLIDEAFDEMRRYLSIADPEEYRIRLNDLTNSLNNWEQRNQ